MLKLKLWPPDAKNQLIGKDPDAGKGGRWEKKGTTEDDMVGCIHICIYIRDPLSLSTVHAYRYISTYIFSLPWKSPMKPYMLSINTGNRMSYPVLVCLYREDSC